MASGAVNRGDVISGALLAGVGVFIVVEARMWEYIGLDGPGPGFFPLWYGLAMVALSLLLVASSFLRRRGSENAAPVNWREVPTTGYPAWVQPTGATDAYAIGDRVQHNDKNWENNTPANVWEPGVFGWDELA